MTYIGVTGFTETSQVRSALEAFPLHPTHALMVGVAASWKSLRGLPLKPHWAKRMPPPERIASLFLPDRRAENLIHYSCDPEQEPTLLDDLLRLNDLAGPHFHGFQLNITWPDPMVLDKFKQQAGVGKEIVINIGPKAVEIAGQTPKNLARRVAEYEYFADAILFDPSQGQGLEFDPERAREFLLAIDDADLDLQLGVAGGLGPETVWRVGPLLRDFPQLSIDAESRLRTPDNELDLDKVRAYLYHAIHWLE